MSVCQHDPYCSGAGWAHDAELTPTQREELGLPEEGEVSVAHAKRLMRAYRKGWGLGFQQGLDKGTELSRLSIEKLTVTEGATHDQATEQPTA